MLVCPKDHETSEQNILQALWRLRHLHFREPQTGAVVVASKQLSVTASCADAKNNQECALEYRCPGPTDRTVVRTPLESTGAQQVKPSPAVPVSHMGTNLSHGCSLRDPSSMLMTWEEQRMVSVQYTNFVQSLPFTPGELRLGAVKIIQ